MADDDPAVANDIPAVAVIAHPVRWGMGDAVLGTVASLLVPNIIAIVVIGIAGLSAAEADDLALWAVFLLQIPLWVVLIGVAVLIARRKGSGRVVTDFGLRFRWPDVPLGLVVGVVAQVFFTYALIPLYELFGIDRDAVGKTAEELADRAHGPFNVALLVVMVVVMAPLVEELFYRGVWLRSAQRRLGTVGGVVLSSLVFGAMHLQGVDTFALVGFGAVAAVLAVRSGRLGPSIFAHVGFNLVALVALLN